MIFWVVLCMEQKLGRKKQAEQTKKKIFETAVSLIKEKGYNNITISEICKTAGVAKGSFYVHYKSKEDIVRESYYADMGEYIQQRYNVFVEANTAATYDERIIYFMNLELKFAEYAGYEVTCLAYTLNLGACIPGPSEHIKRRAFTQILHNEVQNNIAQNHLELSADEIFCYLESFVRGVMATWCFSNNSFSIAEYGRKYIPLIVHSAFAN